MNLRHIGIFGIFQIILMVGISNGTEFVLRTELGTMARIDLLNAIKIALKTADPRPTKEEKAAALQFAKFLNTSYANDYLEGYYARHRYDQVNDLLSFLNAYVYNGDPRHPSWRAAEKLIEMLKTKTNTKLIEALRARTKTPGSLFRAQFIDTNAKNIDFVKLYRNPKIFQLKPIKPKLRTYYIKKNMNSKARLLKHAQNRDGTSYLIDSNKLKLFLSSRRSVDSRSGVSKTAQEQTRKIARNKARMESIYRKLLAIAIRNVFRGTTSHYGTEWHPTDTTERLPTSNKSTRPWKNLRKCDARFPTKTISLAEFLRIKGNSQVPNAGNNCIQKYKSENGLEYVVQQSLDDSVQSRGLPNNPTPLRKENDNSVIRVKRTVSKMMQKNNNRAQRLYKNKNNWKYITSHNQPSGLPNSYTKSYYLKLRSSRRAKAVKDKTSHIRQKRMVSRKLTPDNYVEERILSKGNSMYVSSNKQIRGTPNFYTDSIVLRNRNRDYPKTNHKPKIRKGSVVYDYNRRVDPNHNNYRPQAVSIYQI